MGPGVRKLVLTSHITSSVAWFGSVACFVVLAVAGLQSVDEPTVRGAYLSMGLLAWFVILPLSFVSPVSGIVQSLITRWGLFRYYWIVAKLLITIPATLILILHMESIQSLAQLAHDGPLADGHSDDLRVKLVTASIGALIALFVATALSVYKPFGEIPFPRQSATVGGVSTRQVPLWMIGSAILVGLLLTVFIIAHVTGMHH